MAPRIEVYDEDTQDVLASVEVYPSAAENTTSYIGTKLLELVQMGHMRNPSRGDLKLHVSVEE